MARFKVLKQIEIGGRKIEKGSTFTIEKQNPAQRVDPQRPDVAALLEQKLIAPLPDEQKTAAVKPAESRGGKKDA